MSKASGTASKTIAYGICFTASSSNALLVQQHYKRCLQIHKSLSFVVLLGSMLNSVGAVAGLGMRPPVFLPPIHTCPKRAFRCLRAGGFEMGQKFGEIVLVVWYGSHKSLVARYRRKRGLFIVGRSTKTLDPKALIAIKLLVSMSCSFRYFPDVNLEFVRLFPS